MNQDPSTSGSPIKRLDSEDAACNVGGTKGVSRVQSVPDGATLSFEIRSYANDPSQPRIDRRHYGPCAMYLKKVSSAIDDKAVGDGWFKLFDHGYDASTKRWCTDEIIDNNGLLNINLPKGLEGGQYLARPEILALHAADAGDPQIYTGCAQINIESTGNLGPESTVSIPGHMKYGEPSTDFNIYNSDLSTYQLPGPAVAKLVAKPDSASISSTLTQGLKPEGCIVENAEWCGKEVPDYSDEKGCWAADSDCWAQGKKCYDSVGPTGGKGCELWQEKCTALQAQCKAGNFNGPPNKGKVLTPEKKSIDVGLIMATVGGGGDKPSYNSSPKSSAAAESKTAAPAQSTPAAEYEQDAESTPASSAPKVSPAAPKPTPNDSYTAPQNGDKDQAKPPVQQKEQAKPTITAAPAAPKTTALANGRTVTHTEVATLVQTVYVTVAADAYKRGVESFMARRKRAHHHM
jgi:hypothetical protein